MMNPNQFYRNFCKFLVAATLFLSPIFSCAQTVTYFEKLANLSGDQNIFSAESIENTSKTLDSLVFAMKGSNTFRIAGVDLLPIGGYFKPEDGNKQAYGDYLNSLKQGDGEFIAFFVDYTEEGKRDYTLEFSLPRGGYFDTIPESNRTVIENRLQTTFQLYAENGIDHAVYQTLAHCVRLLSGDEEIEFSLEELGFVKLVHTEDVVFPVLTQGNVAPLSNQVQLGLYDYSGLYIDGVGLGASFSNLATFQTYSTAVYFSSNHDATSSDLVDTAAETFGQESELYSLWLFYEWTSPTDYSVWAKSHTNISQEVAYNKLVEYFDTNLNPEPENNFSESSEESADKNILNGIPNECIGKISTISALAAQFPYGNWKHGTDWTAFCIGANLHPDAFSLNPIENILQLHDGFIAGVVDGLAGTVSGIYFLASGFWELQRHNPNSKIWLIDLIVKTIDTGNIRTAWQIKESEQREFYETFNVMVKKISEDFECMWNEVKASFIDFLQKLNPLSGLYSTAYIHGIIAFEIIMEVITGGVGSIASVGKRVASLGKNAAELLLQPERWGSHIDNFALRFKTSVLTLKPRAVSCLSSIGQCFIGSTLVVMANGPLAAKPIEFIKPMDLVNSRVDTKKSDLTFLELLSEDPLVSADQIFYDQFFKLEKDAWLIGEFSAEDEKLALSIVRPKEWFQNLGATEKGSKALIQLPEMGIAHHFTLNKLRALSSSEEKLLSKTGMEQPVTATIRRTAPLVLALVLPGDTIGVTPEHRIYSHDRQDYVPAGQLLPGEMLTTESGTTQLTKIDTLARSETVVYNLEVRKNHNFYVGKEKVLTHNAYGREFLQKIRERGTGTLYKLDDKGRTIFRPDGTPEVDEFSTAVAYMDSRKLNQFYDELNIKPIGEIDENAQYAPSFERLGGHPNRSNIEILRSRNKFDFTNPNYGKNNPHTGSEMFDPETGGYVTTHPNHNITLGNADSRAEFLIAESYARDGKKVLLLNEQNAPGVPTPDAEIDGYGIFDFKNIGANAINIESNVMNKVLEVHRQADNIALSLMDNPSATVSRVNQGILDAITTADNAGGLPLPNYIGVTYANGGSKMLTTQAIRDGARF